MTKRKKIVNPCLDSSSYLKEHKSYVNYTSLLKNDLSRRRLDNINKHGLTYTPTFKTSNEPPVDIAIGQNVFPIIRQNGRKFWIPNRLNY